MKSLSTRGLEVAIHANGAALEEHDDPEHPATRTATTAYIEAPSDAAFSVKVSTCWQQLRLPAPNDALSISVYLDGEWVRCKVVDVNKGSSDCTINGALELIGAGSSAEKEFRFATLRTDEGSVKEWNVEAMKSLGEIKATCRWVRKQGISMEPARRSNAASEGADVPEKCLKGRAISSRAVLGATKACRDINMVEVTQPYGPEPFTTFTFKYRSRQDLQVEGILPRSPSPEPEVPLEEREPESLTAEEARELVRILRERGTGIKKEIKKEGAERRGRSGEWEGDDELTIEGEGPVRKRARRQAMDFVDLTAD